MIQFSQNFNHLKKVKLYLQPLLSQLRTSYYTYYIVRRDNELEHQISFSIGNSEVPSKAKAELEFEREFK